MIVWDLPHIQVQAFPLQHGVPTLGYLFREKPKHPRLDGARLQALGLPEEALLELRKGNPILHQGQTYTAQDFLLPPLLREVTPIAATRAIRRR